MKIFSNDVSAISSSTPVSDEKGSAVNTKSDKAIARNRRTKFPKDENKIDKKSEKKNLSANEIREKLAANIEMSNSAKSAMKSKNTQQFGTGFMNENFTPPEIEKPKNQVESNSVDNETNSVNLKDHILNSDIKKNDPNDSTTTEKLKTVLQKSAFNFNPKEREVLDKILNDQ